MKTVTPRVLRTYSTKSGNTPFLEWLDKLKDPITRQRVRRRLDRLEIGNFGDCEPIGEGVSELRLFFGSGYRIYFVEYDDVIIILLCAGDKHTQKRDIEIAKKYWLDLKEKSHE